MLDESIKEKIALFADIDKEAVITGLDVDNVYKIPLVFHEEGMLRQLNEKLSLNAQPNLETWKTLVNNMQHAPKEINIALCGKYTKLEDSYASVIEALHHAGAHTNVIPRVHWVETTHIEEGRVSVQDALRGMDGIIVPGGFGSRGAEGKISVIQHARTHNTPYLGLCYGMQLAVIEFARNRCGLTLANSTEINPKTIHPVVDLLPDQVNVLEKGATMRLGGQNVEIKPQTKAEKLFGPVARLRFRHRYEVNPTYISQLENAGLLFSGKAREQDIMQIMELPDHPFFMATQAHPELTSRLDKPCPFFHEFMKASAGKK